MSMGRSADARLAPNVSRPVGQHCSQINRAAIAYGWATTAPAERISALVETKLRPLKQSGQAALSELPELFRTIRASEGERGTAQRHHRRGSHNRTR